eukprot:3028974-Lingulodinium_polyedra.AAC.1
MLRHCNRLLVSGRHVPANDSQEPVLSIQPHRRPSGPRQQAFRGMNAGAVHVAGQRRVQVERLHDAQLR